MSDFDSFRADYQAIPASQTKAVLAGQSGKGATGDILDRLIITPLTTGAGDVTIFDGGGAAIKVFATGILADLKPHVLLLGSRSVNGAWQVSTGANVSVLAVGRFQ